MKVNKFLVFITLSLVLFSCKNEITNVPEYLKYLANPKNGIVKEKEVGGLIYKVKYLPVEYLAYRSKDLENEQKYAKTLSFLFTITPDSTNNVDLNKLGVSNYEEYSQRIHQFNFEMQNNISIKAGRKIINPQFVQFENNYGIKHEKSFIVICTVDKNLDNSFAKENELQFIFNDPIFNSGISKFKFFKEDLEDLPKLSLK